ncbi:hypothetical protein D3C73_993010 [compost metagenome]
MVQIADPDFELHPALLIVGDHLWHTAYVLLPGFRHCEPLDRGCGGELGCFPYLNGMVPQRTGGLGNLAESRVGSYYLPCRYSRH